MEIIMKPTIFLEDYKNRIGFEVYGSNGDHTGIIWKTVEQAVDYANRLANKFSDFTWHIVPVIVIEGEIEKEDTK